MFFVVVVVFVDDVFILFICLFVCLFFVYCFRLAEDPSILSVVAQTSPPSQPLPMDLSSPVGVAQSYPAHSTTEQRTVVSATHRSEQGPGSIVSRVETVEASETPLDAPPGEKYLFLGQVLYGIYLGNCIYVGGCVRRCVAVVNYCN